MIIEISGIPGSGKSTLFENVVNSDMDNCTFIQNRFNILYDFYLFVYFLINMHKTYKYASLLNLILKSENSVFHKVNIIRNIIKKISKYLIYKNKKGFFVFDEGVSHIAFNLFVDSSNKNIDELDVYKILDLFDLNSIIIIEASEEIVTQRIMTRGHKRVNVKDSVDVQNFVKNSILVQGIMKKYYEKEQLFIIQNEKELSKAIKELEKILKDLNV